jgi:hypothetical protein
MSSRKLVSHQYKKKIKLEVGNYRPVSVLSAVSKILERAVYKQVEEYLQDRNLLYHLQSGFRQHHSTNTCLIYLTNYIKCQVSSGKYVGMVALDVQKSFDCVHHDILCRKLEIMGIDSTWFLSYLTGRSQVVVANGIQSEVEQIQCGVPQGSLLGPLLYLCYCNDMEMAADCNLILYANDSIILYADSDPKVIENKLANELASINHWLIENKLLLHPDKCEAILFASKRKIKLVKDFVINFNGTNIVGTQHIKYLGSIVENDLSGKECVKSIIKKVNRRLKFLCRYKSMLTRDVRKILAISLVQCQIDYSVMCVHHGITISLRNTNANCR